MVINFYEHREAERHAREAAIQCSAINPTRAVDRASISTAAAASLEDIATPSTTPQAPVGRSPQITKQVDRSKGKELARAADPTKRTREGVSQSL